MTFRPHRVRFALALLALAALLAGGASAASAQGYQLEGLQGDRLAADQVENGTWIVVVWASWSPRARGIGARIDALHEQFGRDARVVGVHFQESVAEVRSSLGALPAAPIYVDSGGDFSRRYQLTDLPALLVVRGGKVVHRGRLSANAAAVIQPLLDAS